MNMSNDKTKTMEIKKGKKENMIGACFCTRCGEPLTAPQFYKGNPYGWSCVKIVNPSAKKSKVKLTIADSSNFDARTKDFTQKITVIIAGKKYTGYVFKCREKLTWTGSWCQIDNNNNVYVNMDFFKKRR